MTSENIIVNTQTQGFHILGLTLYFAKKDIHIRNNNNLHFLHFHPL